MEETMRNLDITKECEHENRLMRNEMSGSRFWRLEYGD